MKTILYSYMKIIFDQPAEILSKTDKGELSKQLKFFDGKQNIEFQNKVRSLTPSTNLLEFLEFLRSDFCEKIFIENKLKIHTEIGNVFYNNLDTNESIYTFFLTKRKSIKG